VDAVCGSCVSTNPPLLVFQLQVSCSRKQKAFCVSAYPQRPEIAEGYRKACPLLPAHLEELSCRWRVQAQTSPHDDFTALPRDSARCLDLPSARRSAGTL